MGAVWCGVKLTVLLDQLSNQFNLGDIEGAVLYAQDGNMTTLLIDDLLADEVIVADTLDGKPLSIKHGAPLRLIAPGHYGYKNLKHLTRIELYSAMPIVKRGFSAFLDHPRARVVKEERSRWIPGWIIRYVYRLLISSTAKDFEKALRKYESGSK
jgi:DMSO/TMAO reductase YedYZ molybdopterin-dependent catalytic subunit